jgi:hypothetical protein
MNWLAGLIPAVSLQSRFMMAKLSLICLFRMKDDLICIDMIPAILVSTGILLSTFNLQSFFVTLCVCTHMHI